MDATTILLVHEEPAILDLVNSALDRSGYQVLLASNPNQAMEIARRRPVDLVLADSRLPGTSGPRLAEEIVRLSPSTGALLLCDHPASLEIPLGVEVQKTPCSAKALRKRVEWVLARAAKARSAVTEDLRQTRELLARAGRLVSDLQAVLAECRHSRERRATLRGHCSDEILEQDALGQLDDQSSGGVERHLLDCEWCRARRIKTADFLNAFRELQEVPIDIIHFTENGPIQLLVSRAAAGGWEASFVGLEQDGPKLFGTLSEANDFLLDCFRLMFPDHHCDERCCAVGDEAHLLRAARD